MPSPDFLSQLIYEQTNLDKICAERPLDWSEYHHMNHFHGNHSIIADYAGIPDSKPLPLGIEHAIPYDLSEAYSYDIESGLPTFLAVHQKSTNLYLKKGIPHVTPVGFSYLYALDLFNDRHAEESEIHRQGTIFFPDKSTLLMNTDFDRHALAHQLINLPSEYQPVVICIYWKDYVRGTHSPFQEAGLPIVSAGHIMDADFQLRLHDLCRHFKYSAANDLAGSFTMSVLSGCHFFHVNSGPLTQCKHGKTETHNQDPTLSLPVKRACIEASPFPVKNPASQRKLALYNAGAEHKRSPSELRTLIENARQTLRQSDTVHDLKINTQTKRSAFFSLLPKGIDLDGWCRNYCELIIPRRSGSTVLSFQIEIPQWAEWKIIQMNWCCNGSPLIHNHMTCRFHEIQMAFQGDVDDVWHIQFETDRDTILPDQPRKRAFRIHSFNQH